MVNPKTMGASIISIVIAIIILFQIVGNMGTAMVAAANNISNTDVVGDESNISLPLNSIFASDGVVYIIFMAMLLVLGIGIVFKKHKTR